MCGKVLSENAEMSYARFAFVALQILVKTEKLTDEKYFAKKYSYRV